LPSIQTRVPGLLLSTFVVACFANDAVAARYQVVDLGPTANNLEIRGINDRNEIVGSLLSPGLTTRLWLPAPAHGLQTGWNTIAPLPTAGFRAAGINNAGHISSLYYSAGGGGSALWLPEPAFGRPAGWNPVTMDNGSAGGINNKSQFAGHAHNSEQAYVWMPTPDYGLPAGQTIFPSGQGYEFGIDINDSGQFTGYSADGLSSRPILWLPSPNFGLPEGMNLLDPMPGDSDTIGYSINASGQIAGRSYRPFGNQSRTRAFVWLPEPKFGLPAGYFDLGGYDPNGSYYYVSATSINDSMQVVGSNSRGGFDVNAFLWEPGPGMQNLNNLIDPESGWSLTYAMDINQNGSIIGLGKFNGVDHAYLLVIPEPTTIAPCVALALAMIRRRAR